MKRSDDSTMSKGMNHSTSELKLIEIEARLKKQEEFSITVENFSKELNEMKTQLVKIFFCFIKNYIAMMYYFCFKSNILKGIERKNCTSQK